MFLFDGVVRGLSRDVNGAIARGKPPFDVSLTGALPVSWVIVHVHSITRVFDTFSLLRHRCMNPYCFRI